MRRWVSRSRAASKPHVEFRRIVPARRAEAMAQRADEPEFGAVLRSCAVR
jgi:hypothetical protein